MVKISRAFTQWGKREIDVLWNKAYPVLRQDGLFFLCSPRQGTLGRLLLVIPRKVGSAPVRNKIRRQLKAFFYEEKLFNEGFDWIVIVKSEAQKLTYQQIKDLFLQAIKKPKRPS